MSERVLICGDRHWKDYSIIYCTLRDLAARVEVELVIEGEAPGADTWGRIAATVLGIPVMRFPADWRKHGRAAGPIRNQQMLDNGKPTLVLAFHDDIENSKGTKDMVARARKAKIPVELHAHQTIVSDGRPEKPRFF